MDDHEDCESPAPAIPHPGTRVDAFEVMRAWEQRRLVYNGVLLLAGIGVMLFYFKTETNIPLEDGIGSAIAIAVMANVCFCLAPLLEFYSAALRGGQSWSSTARDVLLGLGILISLGVFGIAVLAILFGAMLPAQN